MHLGWFQTPYPISKDCKAWLRISRFKARRRKKKKGTRALKSGRRFKFGHGHILAAMLFWTSYLLSGPQFPHLESMDQHLALQGDCMN